MQKSWKRKGKIKAERMARRLWTGIRQKKGIASTSEKRGGINRETKKDNTQKTLC